MNGENPLLKRAYALGGDPDEIRKVYADWAGSYDADTTEGMGYVAPRLAAEALVRIVGENANVLDAGCGTGLAGAELEKQADLTIDGFDLSAGMLEEAAQKGAYARLFEADMTKPFAIAEDSYDGVICVGVFTSGHVGPDAIGELVRVAKPGAPVVFTVHEKVWSKDGYPDAIAALEASGRVHIDAIADIAYHEKEGYRAQLCVIRAA